MLCICPLKHAYFYPNVVVGPRDAFHFFVHIFLMNLLPALSSSACNLQSCMCCTSPRMVVSPKNTRLPSQMQNIRTTFRVYLCEVVAVRKMVRFVTIADSHGLRFSDYLVDGCSAGILDLWPIAYPLGLWAIFAPAIC